eukprot:g4278.t1
MEIEIGNPLAEAVPLPISRFDRKSLTGKSTNGMTNQVGELEDQAEKIDEEVHVIEKTLDKIELAEKRAKRHLAILIFILMGYLVATLIMKFQQTLVVNEDIDAHDDFSIGKRFTSSIELLNVNFKEDDTLLCDREGNLMETKNVAQSSNIAMVCDVTTSAKRPMQTFSTILPTADTKTGEKILTVVEVSSVEYFGYDEKTKTIDRVVIRGVSGEILEIPCYGVNQKVAAKNFPSLKTDATALTGFVTYEEIMLIKKELETGKKAIPSKGSQTQTTSTCERYYKKACLQFSLLNKTGSQPNCDCTKVCESSYEKQRAHFYNKYWCTDSDTYKMYKDIAVCNDTLPCGEELALTVTFF